MSVNEKQGTLLIPDISGFTEFVSSVELLHSQHIIAELLEIIIDANDLGLEISEIEGDAILFYRLGPPPTLQALKEQAQTFYLKFHQYLQQIKRDTFCKCGACQNVGALTLKIIFSYKPFPVIGFFLDKMVRPRLARMFEEICEGLKKVAEESVPIAEVKK